MYFLASLSSCHIIDKEKMQPPAETWLFQNSSSSNIPEYSLFLIR